MIRKIRFQCSFKTCGHYFDTEHKRDQHEKLIHRRDGSAIILKEPEPEVTAPVVEKSAIDFPVACPKCPKRYKSDRALRRHNTEQHGGTPHPVTVQARARRERIAAEGSTDVQKDDAQRALVKITQENIRLSKEHKDLKAKYLEVVDALEEANNKLYEMYEKYEPIDSDASTPGRGLIRVADELDKLKDLVYGNKTGHTEEERLGLLKRFDIISAANEDLQLQVKQAKAGLIPDQWLERIKDDLRVSMDIVVEGMKNTVKDRSKVAKYEKLRELLSEVTDE